MAEKILITAGILFAAYGVTVKLAGSVTNFFLVWFFGAALCCLAALFLRMGFFGRLPFAVRVLIILLLLWACSLFVFVMALIGRHFRDSGRPDLDYIIVLGAQVFPYGPSSTLKYRLDRAYDYLQENPDTICIVSGGQGYNEPEPEGTAMKRYLMERGIPEDRILAETGSKTTEENLRFSRELMRDGNCSVGIVTNHFHVYRALKEAERQGYTDVCGIAARGKKIFLPNYLLREFFAVLKYQLHPGT